MPVYLLFAAVGVAIGICGFQLIRNLCINPEVRSEREEFQLALFKNRKKENLFANWAILMHMLTTGPSLQQNML
ncbi:hypothetical protein Taro_020750 [Colocasia esculenta]|uniref:Uncharacterized protein n=1 Tax=Colocasia esculenta TaxID=4460 RepID=A0A843UPG8_COLES|nr:hypothetical protein [Colocasia esculenta]